MTYDLYDFDKTVYPWDSESLFYLFCLLRRPWILVCAPYQFVCLACFLLHIGGDAMKGRFFCFLRLLDGPQMAKRFWAKHQRHIRPFFHPKNRTRPTVVCSASPAFFLKPICDQLQVDVLVATRMDEKTGRILGKNCKGPEKVQRLREALPDASYHTVYSDSIENDRYIFALGQACYHVVGDKLYPLDNQSFGKDEHP